MVAFKGVGTSLRLLNEFSVRDTSGRPTCREMISIEFVQANPETRGADNDSFSPFLSYPDEVHCTAEGFSGFVEIKIPHSSGVGSGIRRERYKRGASGFQTRNYDIFQMP